MARNNTKTRSNNQGKVPSYIAYYVPPRDNAPWIRIGAAWEHSDGQGMTAQLDLVPTDGGRIVYRVYDPDLVEDDTAEGR